MTFERWEYDETLISSGHMSVEELNTLGATGWELVTVEAKPGETFDYVYQRRYLFKRRVGSTESLA